MIIIIFKEKQSVFFQYWRKGVTDRQYSHPQLSFFAFCLANTFTKGEFLCLNLIGVLSIYKAAC